MGEEGQTDGVGNEEAEKQRCLSSVPGPGGQVEMTFTEQGTKEGRLFRTHQVSVQIR